MAEESTGIKQNTSQEKAGSVPVETVPQASNEHGISEEVIEMTSSEDNQTVATFPEVKAEVFSVLDLEQNVFLQGLETDKVSGPAADATPHQVIPLPCSYDLHVICVFLLLPLLPSPLCQQVC